MANRLSKEKANLIASNYMTNGLKKVQALLDAGYSTSYANNVGLKLFDNERVKEAIARIQASTVVKSEYTIDDCDRDYERIMKASEENKQYSTSATCVTGRARLRGWDKDNMADKQEAEAITPEELELLKKQAEAITKPNIKLNAG